MMELVISSHHSGLIDCLTPDGDNVYESRLGKDVAKTHFTESIERIPNIFKEVEEDREAATVQLASKIEEICEDSKAVKDKGCMRAGLLCRFILSCLIDADRTDTARFYSGSYGDDLEIDWMELRRRLEDHLSSFNTDDRVSRIRRSVSDECLDAASKNTGIFTLSVPTGGGKTLSGFRFALNHLIANDLDRIIVVVPYLSIIEQNASVLRKVLDLEDDDDYVTECHSGVDVGQETEDGECNRWDYGVDSWNRPIIFTSMVQFLDVLYSSGTRRVRRMHNLSRSVIIFDEVQSLPLKVTYMFNEAVSFLTRYCGSTVVLSTATQPCLDGDLEYKLDGCSEIIADTGKLFDSLRRTNVTVVNETDAGPEYIAELAASRLDMVESVLVIVNTKRMARQVFEEIGKLALEDVEVRHLSTNMCPVHRRKVLDEVRSMLGKRKLVCVSTQLIEAGVDVDFACVIRSMAGLDSIAQAAGRCNRNGKAESGDVLVVRTNEKLGQLEDIAEGRRCAESTLRRYGDDPLSPDAIRDYYDRYFFKAERKMEYQTDNADLTLFKLLSSNRPSVQAYRSRHNKSPKVLVKQSFRTANALFHVIDETDALVVPYDGTAREAIRTLCSHPGPDEMKRSLRVLQHYSVNSYDVNRMVAQGMAYEAVEGSGIYCLADGFYDESTGVCDRPDTNALIFRRKTRNED